MAIHLRRPAVTAKSAKPKAVAAEYTIRPSRGKRIVAPGTAASKPGSFGQHLVAPPPDRELGIVMAQSPELETAPAFSDSIIDAVRQPLVVLDEATFVVLATPPSHPPLTLHPPP